MDPVNNILGNDIRKQLHKEWNCKHKFKNNICTKCGMSEEAYFGDGE